MKLLPTLDSSFSLQCDGVPMSLPSLQGLAVLNIPSYAGGINFWGGTKEDNVGVAFAVASSGVKSFRGFK